MAAVHENQVKARRRRTRQKDGRRSQVKVCTACNNETKWLSVDGTCWACTVSATKNKVPIHVDNEEESTTDSTSDIFGQVENW